MISAKGRKLILLLYDIVAINISLLIALFLRFDFHVQGINSVRDITLMALITVIYVIVFKVMNLYNSLWSYASIDELLFMVLANTVGAFLSIVINSISSDRLPYSVVIIAAIIISMLTLGFRLAFRFLRRFENIKSKVDKSQCKRTVIIGAGTTGVGILKDINRTPEMGYLPVGFIDDNTYKLGKVIGGIKVLGTTDNIEALVKNYSIDSILISIPSMDIKKRKEMVKLCSETGCEVKIIPGVCEVLSGQAYLKQMRSIDLKDLLGRDPVYLDNEGIEGYIEGARVLVTGGGGSIGSELCRQIIKFNPSELIVLDIYENNAYDLQNELLRNYPKLNLKVIIASVRDKKRLEKVFEEYRPTVVFHAAAHKHVPLMEFSPGEAIKNNVIGTLNTAECADKYGVRRFVLISTDKAVNPTNVMGASKRMCEMVIQAINPRSKTEFVAVRFGNVLGSNGSVIPLFKRQIEAGGPLTVTDKNITRFFMLIPEAAQLVLQAGAYARGGEIFVLDMGSPIRIYDMARDLIRLSGYEPEVDIKIEVTGLRPGEKLYEELLMDEEGLENTAHEKIFIGKPATFDFAKLKKELQEVMDVVAFGTKEQIKTKISEVVPTYKRTCGDTDIKDDGITRESSNKSGEEYSGNIIRI